MTTSAAGQWASWLRERDAHGSQLSKARVASELETIRDRVLDGARLRPGDRVVDVGAGTGLLAAEAARRVGPGGQVTAVDLSAAALSCINAPVISAAGSATRLPLRDGCADAVVSRSVLVYVDDVEAAVAEAARILRPGGRISLFEPLNARRAHDAMLDGFPKERRDELVAAQAAASRTVQTMFAFTTARLQRALRTAGFDAEVLAEEPHRQQLADEAAAEKYLQQRGHAGAATVLEQVASLWGKQEAARYRNAWLAAARAKPITFTTPVLYAAATLPSEPAARRPTES